VSNLFGDAGYIGIEQQPECKRRIEQLHTLFPLANIWMVRHWLLATG